MGTNDRNVRVSMRTWNRLNAIGRKGQSYDDIIDELLDKVEKDDSGKHR